MSKLICPNCGNESQIGYKFCIFCGGSLERLESTQQSKAPVIFKPPVMERNTFFCPKCHHENHIDNYSCKNCGEDFDKYNIKASFSQTSVSRIAKAKDYAAAVERNYPRFSFDSPLMIVLLVVAIGLIGFLIWIIIRFISNI